MQKEELKCLLDEDILIRTLFDSEHYDGESGILEKNAIPTSDLKERGLSLDIKRLASESVVLERVNVQKTRAQNKNGSEDKSRKDVYFSELNHPIARGIVDDGDGGPLFSTQYAPVPDNDAHAMLKCNKNSEKKSYYVMARNKLIPIFSKEIISAQQYKFLKK